MNDKAKKNDELQKQILAKRQQKFSETARTKIINDPLRDTALLSRSASSNVKKLLATQQAREEFLKQLQLEASQKPDNQAVLEHSLRKLREVIVSVYDENESDPKFLDFVTDVYKMSYNLYLSKREFSTLGGIVLNFMASKLPQLSEDYTTLYIIYLSHVEHNMDKCLSLIMKGILGGSVDSLSHKLVRLSLIYENHTTCPSEWFQILKTFPSDSLLHKFLKASPAYLEMKQRCFQMVEKCYNQIPLDFLLNGWFHGFVLVSEISKNYQITTNSHGTQIIAFAKGKH